MNNKLYEIVFCVCFNNRPRCFLFHYKTTSSWHFESHLILNLHGHIDVIINLFFSFLEFSIELNLVVIVFFFVLFFLRTDCVRFLRLVYLFSSFFIFVCEDTFKTSTRKHCALHSFNHFIY